MARYNFKIIVNGTLLELEYTCVEALQKDLTKQMLGVDSRGLRPTDYTGYNYKAKFVSRWGTLAVRKALQKYPNTDYVIGYVRGDIDTIEHERRHYLFFKDDVYRKKMTRIFEQPRYAKYLDILRKKGYRDEVLIDEAQAHYHQLVNIK